MAGSVLDGWVLKASGKRSLPRVGAELGGLKAENVTGGFPWGSGFHGCRARPLTRKLSGSWPGSHVASTLLIKAVVGAEIKEFAALF